MLKSPVKEGKDCEESEPDFLGLVSSSSTSSEGRVLCIWVQDRHASLIHKYLTEVPSGIDKCSQLEFKLIDGLLSSYREYAALRKADKIALNSHILNGGLGNDDSTPPRVDPPEIFLMERSNLVDVPLGEGLLHSQILASDESTRRLSDTNYFVKNSCKVSDKSESTLF